MSDRIHCTACDGTGRAPLGRRLQETLDWLRAQGRACSADEAARALGVQLTTMHYRLATLRGEGFVARSRARRIASSEDGIKRGPSYLWAAAETPPEDA